MKLYEVKPGMKIEIPIRKKTIGGLIVARIMPGTFKSSLIVTFKGGYAAHLPRDTEVTQL